MTKSSLPKNRKKRSHSKVLNLILIFSVLGLLGSPFFISLNHSSHQAVAATVAKKKPQITLYATSWCPYCEKARKFFKKKNVEYFEYNIEKSKEGNDQYKKLNGQGIPVVVIGKQVIYGYDEPAMNKALTKLKK